MRRARRDGVALLAEFGVEGCSAGGVAWMNWRVALVGDARWSWGVEWVVVTAVTTGFGKARQGNRQREKEKKKREPRRQLRLGSRVVGYEGKAPG